MAIDLDNVIELFNAQINLIEQHSGSADDRTNSISEWLVSMDKALQVVKGEWKPTSSRNPEYSESLLNCFAYLGLIGALGVCCLEQYSNLIPDSCPWEHSFDLEGKKSLEDAVIYIDALLAEAKQNYTESDEYCLYSIKSIVLESITCLLQNVPEEHFR
jgi:hypothetical protein